MPTLARPATFQTGHARVADGRIQPAQDSCMLEEAEALDVRIDKDIMSNLRLAFAHALLAMCPAFGLSPASSRMRNASILPKLFL